MGCRTAQAGKWEPFVVKDGQLVTGQNPASSEKLARCILETLKPCAPLSPAPRPIASVAMRSRQQSGFKCLLGICYW
jgi:hypothetical protein